jgi:hypothetical protein
MQEKMSTNLLLQKLFLTKGASLRIGHALFATTSATVLPSQLVIDAAWGVLRENLRIQNLLI